MSAWNRIRPQDIVNLRGKRSGVRNTVEVAEIRAPIAGDGRGFLGVDGEVHRFFYWDVAIAETRSETIHP
jgi:hypothetical protein